MTSADIRNWADQLEREGRSSTATLLRALADVAEAATGLLERVDINGGLGAYDHGPAFVVKRTREALDRLSELKP